MRLVAIPLLLAVAMASCVSGPEQPAASVQPSDVSDSFALGPSPPLGDEHASLEPLVGDWSLELLPAAGGEPIARGAARIEWCLSGRFLCWDSEVELAGASFPSTGMLGFDSASREYQWLWASGWSGRASLARGRGELAAGGLRLVAEEIDPESGAVLRVRSVLRTNGETSFEVVQDVETAPGAWSPTTRTVYTRRNELEQPRP